MSRVLRQTQRFDSTIFHGLSKLLSRSRFFKTNREGVSFGTYQATVLRESVADEAFFAAKHRIKIKFRVETTIRRTITGNHQCRDYKSYQRR